jgi:hypothetical protein
MPLTGKDAKVKPQSGTEASVSEMMPGSQAKHRRRWWIIGWGTAVALLTTPFAAMQFHADWPAADWVIAAALFATACGLVELAVRLRRSAQSSSSS